ncbi:MAG: AI-2E family transporter [Planctomycetes bacterium]|nr:AI-2E family transporter [Planctomycetota bacterium]
MLDRREQAKWLAALGMTLLALYLCWEMVAPFAGVIVLASVLALVFLPVHRRIEARLGRPSASALLSTVLVVLVVVVPVTVVAAVVARQVPALVDGVGDGIERGIALLEKWEPTRAMAEKVRQDGDLGSLLSADRLREGAGRAAQAVVKGTLSVVGGAAGILMNLCFTLFTLFYLFRDGRSIAERMPDFLPLPRDRSVLLLSRTAEVLRASVHGVLVIAAIQGALGGLAFRFLGIPSPFAWGVVMTVFSTIPMLGPFVVWVPAAAWLGLHGEWGSAAVLALWGGLVIGSVDNFLRPKLVGDRVRMHELQVFFSVMGGLHVFGLLGILVGPAVLAVTLGLLEALRLGGEGEGPPAAAGAAA